MLLAVALLSALCILFASCGGGGGEKIVLYVYNWGEYIEDGSGTEDGKSVNDLFEEYCKNEYCNIVWESLIRDKVVGKIQKCGGNCSEIDVIVSVVECGIPIIRLLLRGTKRIVVGIFHFKQELRNLRLKMENAVAEGFGKLLILRLMRRDKLLKMSCGGYYRIYEQYLCEDYEGGEKELKPP